MDDVTCDQRCGCPDCTRCMDCDPGYCETRDCNCEPDKAAASSVLPGEVEAA